jgi:Type VI secretion system (T6SS), amidase immunity protein
MGIYSEKYGTEKRKSMGQPPFKKLWVSQMYYGKWAVCTRHRFNMDFAMKVIAPIRASLLVLACACTPIAAQPSFTGTSAQAQKMLMKN